MRSEKIKLLLLSLNTRSYLDFADITGIGRTAARDSLLLKRVMCELRPPRLRDFRASVPRGSVRLTRVVMSLLGDTVLRDEYGWEGFTNLAERLHIHPLIIWSSLFILCSCLFCDIKVVYSWCSLNNCVKNPLGLDTLVHKTESETSLSLTLWIWENFTTDREKNTLTQLRAKLKAVRKKKYNLVFTYYQPTCTHYSTAITEILCIFCVWQVCWFWKCMYLLWFSMCLNACM